MTSPSSPRPDENSPNTSRPESLDELLARLNLDRPDSRLPSPWGGRREPGPHREPLAPRPASIPPSTGTGDLDLAGCLMIGGGLAVLALVAAIPQVFFVLLALGLAGWAAVAAGQAGRRGWVALSLLIGGLAVAGVLVFIPWEWKAWSLFGAWQATRRHEDRLAALPPDNGNGFRKDRDERMTVAEQFPTALGPRLGQAERTWAGRAVDRLVANLDRRKPGDEDGLRAFRDQREELGKTLAPASPLLVGRLDKGMRRLLDQAEIDWGERALKHTEEKLHALPPDDREGFLAVFASGERQVERVAARMPAGKQRLGRAADAWGERAVVSATARIEALAVLDGEGFRTGQPFRAFLGQRFPGCKDHLRAAERKWGDRGMVAVVQRLRELPPDDLAGYRRGAEERSFLARTFPVRAEEVRREEQGWYQRAVDHLLADLRKVPPADLTGYRAWKARREDLLKVGMERASVLRAGEWQWVERTVVRASAAAAPLLTTDPVAASAQLGEMARRLEAEGFDVSPSPRPGLSAQGRAVAAQLLAARRQAVRASLETARRRVKELVTAQRYQALARQADDLAKKLESEARDTGQGDELTHFRQGCDFLARLAREAGKTDPP